MRGKGQFKQPNELRKIAMYILKNFALCKAKGNPWLAPECMPNVLCGNVYGHSRFEDGSHVETSTIMEVRGRIVKTYSGSEYRLVGTPKKEFRAWLREKGIPYNGKNPLRGLEAYIKN